MCPVPTWQVETEALRRLFQQMNGLGDGWTGDACWSFDPFQLRIEWAGMDLEIPIQGEQSVLARLAAADMRALVRDPLTDTPYVILRLSYDRLYFGNLSHLARRIEQPVPQLLPLKAEARHVLLLEHQQPTEDIAEAGLAHHLAELKEDVAHDIEEATKYLAWLAIDSPLLAAWVDAHLRALAHENRTFDLTPTTTGLDTDHQPRQFTIH